MATTGRFAPVSLHELQPALRAAEFVLMSASSQRTCAN
jgi:hypothetical protein